MKRLNEPDPGRGPGRLKPAPALARPLVRPEELGLEQVKNRLLRDELAGVAAPALVASIRRAANEAAALAWLEPQPLLVFPALFEEKVALARRRVHKQEMIRARSADFLALAA